MKKYAGGFTLVEILAVIAVVAILTALAAPSFTKTIQSLQVTSAVNTFMSDFRLARSEAMRRNVAVVICRSDAPEATTPACGSGDGIDIDGDKLKDGWSSGWIIFEDSNNSRDYTTGEKIIRVQSMIKGVSSILGKSNSSVKVSFTPTGRLRNLASATTLTFGGSFNTTTQRVVCVALSGRIRVAGNGAASCP